MLSWMATPPDMPSSPILISSSKSKPEAIDLADVLDHTTEPPNAYLFLQQGEKNLKALRLGERHGRTVGVKGIYGASKVNGESSHTTKWWKPRESRSGMNTYRTGMNSGQMEAKELSCWTTFLQGRNPVQGCHQAAHQRLLMSVTGKQNHPVHHQYGLSALLRSGVIRLLPLG